jgi:hypothetical protein
MERPLGRLENGWYYNIQMDMKGSRFCEWKVDGTKSGLYPVESLA